MQNPGLHWLWRLSASAQGRADNFERAWPELKTHYDERFHRMWHYYLMCSAATFRTRSDQLFQILLSPEGVPGGLRVPR